MWEHEEEYLGKFLNKFKTFHLTIKFTVDYSQETIDFIDLNVGLVGSELMADLFAKPNNARQLLDPNFPHPSLIIARQSYLIVKP